MRVIDAEANPEQWLLCRMGSRLCALPRESVREVLRPLPTEPLARSPAFVLGLCILRGALVPVIDAAMLLGEPTIKPERLVAIRVNDRTIALAVTAVLGLESITSAGLPPLLREAAGEIIAAITVLDAEILLVLNAARIVPDGLLEDLAAREPVL